MELAIKTGAPRLGAAIKAYGDVKMSAYIKLWLIDLNMMSGVSRPLNDAQLYFTANSIINNYRELSIADINLIFSKAISGDYGQFYEALTPPKVLSWFKDYSLLRMDVCASMAYEKHLLNKENSHEPRNSGTTVKQFIKDKNK